MLTPFTAVRRLSVPVAAALVLAVLALVAAFSWHTSAVADPAYPPAQACAVSVSNAALTPGSTVQVVASGFTAGQVVTLTLHSADIALGSEVASSTGSISTSVTIPASLTGSGHVIEASSSTVNCSSDPGAQSSGIDAASAVAASKPTSGIDGLASTGFATVAASAVGFALLAGGILFLAFGRRRRV